MWCHRRRAATRVASGTRNRTGNRNVPMREPSVERWLAEQNPNSDPEQYAQDTWYVSIHPVLCTPLPHLAPAPILGPCGPMM